MKKFLILIAVLTLSLTLSGCTEECPEPEGLAEIPEVVDMTNVDMYLGRPDVQYVDLRNFDDKMASGYIAGFEMIPFFDYLEATNTLVRTNEWTFEAAGIKSQSGLEELFNADKTIFLMCGSGTRAGFVKDALDSLGYENVINVGGIGSYTGDNKVLGDNSYNLEVQLPLPAVVDMTNIDMYLGRNDVQYVDLRNFDDKMNSGYIAGFEMIPFFEYLEYSNILVRSNGWTYEAASTVNEAALKGLFDMDKTIMLMCGSGTRAGYVKDALMAAGYTKVINVGGIGSYTGDNKVFGDGTYNLTVPAVGPYTPGTYSALDPNTQYQTTVVIGANGAIESVLFDAMYHGTTKNALDEAYTLASGVTWKSEAELLAAEVVANQGWSNITLTVGEIPASGHFIEFDDLAGVTIGGEGFVLSWNLAIAMASEAGTEGVIADVPTALEVQITQGITLTENQYLGYSGGSVAVITVDASGVITAVELDAPDKADSGTLLSMKQAYTSPADYPMHYTFNDQGTEDEADDTWDLAAGKSDWWMQADDLAAAIVANDGWDADWVFDGVEAVDTVAGVTIYVGGWQAAVADAVAQIPAD